MKNALLLYLSFINFKASVILITLKLNKKFGENYLTKGNVVFSKSGDNYEELETILRNQLPLRKAYKLKTDIDDVIMRQMQAVMEYSLEHKMGNGFFETTYMPWIKDVVIKKQLPFDCNIHCPGLIYEVSKITTPFPVFPDIVLNCSIYIVTENS